MMRRAKVEVGMRRISIGLSWQSREGVPDFVEQAKVADDSGVWSIFTGENWRRDAFTPLTVLAYETNNVQLGTSIVNVHSRSAGALAMHFGTLEELSGGRMIIGLGTSSANVTEGFAGVPYGRALQRMREYVEILNILLASKPLQYNGELFQLTRGFRLDIPLPREHTPIYIASMTPRSVKQTAEIADGWTPIELPRSAWKAQTDSFYDAARAAGRDPSALTVRTATPIIVTDEPEAEYERIRGTVTFYVARMGDAYYNNFVRMGYGEMSDAVRAAWAEDGSQGGAAALPAGFERDMGFAGPAEACAEHMDELAEAGFNLFSVTIKEPDAQKRAAIYRQLVG